MSMKLIVDRVEYSSDTEMGDFENVLVKLKCGKIIEIIPAFNAINVYENMTAFEDGDRTIVPVKMGGFESFSSVEEAYANHDDWVA